MPKINNKAYLDYFSNTPLTNRKKATVRSGKQLGTISQFKSNVMLKTNAINEVILYVSRLYSIKSPKFLTNQKDVLVWI